MRKTDDILKSRIINLREKYNWSQVELAKKLGIDNSMISKIESGTRRVSASELDKLSSIFGVTTDYLLGRYEISEYVTKGKAIELDCLLESDSDLVYKDIPVIEEDKEIINNMVAGYFWSKQKRKQQKGNE